MRRKPAVAWFIVSAALTALLIVQWRTLSQQRQLIEKLQIQVEKSSGESRAAEAELQQLRDDQMKLRGELRAAEMERDGARMSLNAALATNAPAGLAASRAAPAAEDGKPGRGNPMGMLNEMMKDPEMRKAMEAQQGMMVEMMYAPLYEKLGLPAEKREALKKLLLEQQMSNIEQAQAMFQTDGTNRMALAQSLDEKRKATEAEIKGIIGEENFGTYEDYTQTMGERMMLNQFSTSNKLQPEQVEELLQIMAEEKRSLQQSQRFPPEGAAGLQEFMENPDFAEQQLAAQEGVNAHVYERARALLDPEQLESFGAFQTNQLNMQRLGLRMAQQMMQEGESPAPPPPVPVVIPASAP